MPNCILTVWVPAAVENTRGFQRRALPAFWLWVSNRGEEQPYWHRVSKGKQRCPWQGYPKGTEFPLAHDFPAGKSSVLYLLRPLTLERGCHHAGQTVSRGSRTDGFCGLKATQNEGFAMSKIRLFVCSWHRKSCSEAERFAVSTGAQEVYKNPQQRHALIFLV